jgi:chemotaxis protein methyltransferase CheR
VFIRNVMIYFDISAKKTILNRIGRLLRPDGYLFLGAAESTMNVDERFQRAPFERAGCYKLAA